MYRVVCLTNRKPLTVGRLEYCRTTADEKNIEAGFTKFIVEPFAVPDAFTIVAKSQQYPPISQEQVLQKTSKLNILDAELVYPDEYGRTSDNPFYDEDEYYKRFYSTEFDTERSYSTAVIIPLKKSAKEKVAEYLKQTQIA
jgi:hypothetical protein